MERLTDRCFKFGFDDSSKLPSYETIYEKLREYEDLELSSLEIRTLLGDFGITVIMRSRKLRKERDYWKNEALK